MKTKKPDYTQFMRCPAPLEMSPPSDRDDSGPPKTSPATAPKAAPSEEDIPWGEIVVEFSPEDTVPLDIGAAAGADRKRAEAEAPSPEPAGSAPLQEVLRQVRAPAADSREDYHAEPAPFEPKGFPESEPARQAESAEYFEGPPLLVMAACLLIPIIMVFLS